MPPLEPPKNDGLWSQLDNEASRRDFLKLMGASFALAGIASCTKMPAEKIFPFATAAQERSGYEKLCFASSSLLNGYAKGVLVESHQGRPTKIEGNSLHPASLGTTDIFTQAEILTLYDPLRSKAVLHLGEISSWDAFHQDIKAQLIGWQQTLGQGVRILSGCVTSPTLASQIQAFLKQFPKASWHNYEPINSDNVVKGAMSAFGQDVRPIYHFDRASVVVSLDADFLGPGIAQQPYARAFVKNKRATAAYNTSFSRLYMIDSSITLTGSMADHRLALKPSQVICFAQALASKLGIAGITLPPAWINQFDHQIDVIATDLLKHAPNSLVLAGDQQSHELHALTHAINHHLGHQGHTVEYIPPPQVKTESLRQLVEDLADDKVDALIMVSTNPAYASPKGLNFSELMRKAKLRIHCGLYEDETSYHCQWHLPESHFLEAFGDARAYDGTISFQQPLIAKLADSRSATELFALLNGHEGTSSYQVLKNYWSSQSLSDSAFEKALHDGVLAKTSLAPIKVSIKGKFLSPQSHATGRQLEISFRPDPTIWDGRYANNGWLQELPKPILQLCWDNSALLSPKTAADLRIEDEDLIELALNNQTVKAPALIVPGHPDNSVTVHLGYGRTRASSVANHLGFNAYDIMPEQGYNATGLTIKKLHTKYPLARTHVHHRMEDRHIVRRGSVHDYQKDPASIVPPIKKPQPTLLERKPSGRYAWAMAIDLNSCIGCNTCTIACQAENNIPIVGKQEVRNAREMHWIRVDRYFEGSADQPQVYFQPVPCMHCETAPCEVVCPTAATNHSGEGINQMVYNRCVGTRYCSNNCPYKVRRFNFLHFSDVKTASMRLMYNPNVTVRSRGVMEKCTYCIQRIEAARIKAQKESRPIADGDITPACAQACPTEAIIFGDQHDPKSRVSKLKALPLNYSLLDSLGTKPRTTYAAKLSNDHPQWKKASPS